MNKLRSRIILGLIVSLVFAKPSLAEADPNRQTFFNSTTDWFATVGKSSKEKRRIKQHRKQMRRQYRAEKQLRKKRAANRKKIKNQEKIIMDKVNAVNNSRYNKK